MKILIISASMIFMLSPTMSMADGCIKKIFDRFCLGADMDKTAAKDKPEKVRKRKYYTSFEYEIDRDLVILSGKNKVATIFRKFKTSNYSTYKNLVSQLVETYGKGVDDSVFENKPGSDLEKRNEVLAGRGKLARIWDQGDWSVRIVWHRTKYDKFGKTSLWLKYGVKDLYKNQKKVKGL